MWPPWEPIHGDGRAAAGPASSAPKAGALSQSTPWADRLLPVQVRQQHLRGSLGPRRNLGGTNSPRCCLWSGGLQLVLILSRLLRLNCPLPQPSPGQIWRGSYFLLRGPHPWHSHTAQLRVAMPFKVAVGKGSGRKCPGGHLGCTVLGPLSCSALLPLLLRTDFPTMTEGPPLTCCSLGTEAQRSPAAAIAIVSSGMDIPHGGTRSSNPAEPRTALQGQEALVPPVAIGSESEHGHSCFYPWFQAACILHSPSGVSD